MKKSIKIALAGLLAVPMMALGINLVTVAQPVAATSNTSNVALSPILNGINSAKGNGQSNDLFGSTGVFNIITNTLLFILGAISVLMLIYGGIRYTISAGDEKNVTAAKNTILYAIVGLIVAILAYAIVNFVVTQFVQS